MACPYCEAASTTEQAQRTALGYRKFRCQACKRLFNERTGTPFNFLEYPTDIVLLVVVWRSNSRSESGRANSLMLLQILKARCRDLIFSRT